MARSKISTMSLNPFSKLLNDPTKSSKFFFSFKIFSDDFLSCQKFWLSILLFNSSSLELSLFFSKKLLNS